MFAGSSPDKIVGTYHMSDIRQIPLPTRWMNILNLPNPSGRIYSASTRNEYHKHKNNNVSDE
jgi:hypothetical protein